MNRNLMFKAIAILLLAALIVAPGAGTQSVRADDGIGVSGVAISTILAPGDLIRSIPAPGGGDPRGITWDGSSLWVSENANKTIYKVNPADGSATAWCTTPGQSFSQGLAWDGAYLWHAEYNGNVYKIDPGSSPGGSCNVLTTISAPTTSPTGLAWDGTYLWTASYINQLIYQFNTSGGLVNSFAPPAGNPWGVAWDGATLWHAQYNAGDVYQLNPADGSVLTSFASPAGSWPLGITWIAASADLWLVDKNTNQIHLIDAGDPACAAATALADETVYPTEASALEVATTLYGLRDGLMSNTEAGRHYRTLFEENTGRISYLLLQDSALRAELGRLLKELTPGLTRLITGNGAEVVVTRSMMNHMLSFLKHLAAADNAHGGKALAQTIGAEQARFEWRHLPGMTFAEAWDYIAAETLR